MGSFEVYVVAVTVTSVSTVASLCLLCSRSVRENRHKLMGRVLWHLAAADIVFGLLSIVCLVVDVLSSRLVDVFRTETSTLDHLCIGLSWGYSVGLNTSVLVEAHLAISFAAAIFKRTGLLKLLRQCLKLTWPLGMLLAALETASDRVVWEEEGGCANGHRDIVGVSSLSFSVVVCTTAYICSLIKVFSAGTAVRDRVWVRAQLFVLVWILALVPNMIRVVARGSSFFNNEFWHLVSLALFNLRGLLNALLYAIQSRYVKRMRLRRARYNRRAFSDLSTGMQHTSVVVKGPGSFHAQVGEVDVVEVPQVNSEAALETEREIAELEHNGVITPEMGSSVGTEGSILGVFEGRNSPPDVRQGLNWTRSLADGLVRRDGPPRSPRAHNNT